MFWKFRHYSQSNHQFLLLLFHIPLLCYYINLSPSIISCLFSGDIYLSLGLYFYTFLYFFIILICNCLWTILLWILWNFFYFIGNCITNQITSCFCFFLITLFQAVLNASVADCLAWSRVFWLYLPLKFFLYVYQYFYPYFQQKTKIHSFLQIFDF